MPIKATISGPLVVLEITGAVQEDEIEVIFDAFERAQRAGPFVALTDTNGMKSAGRPVLTRFAARIKQMPGLSKTWLGDAVVVTSTPVRFILTTLLAITPVPTEVKVFAQRIEARHWCAMVLRRNGLLVPDLLRSA
jgi:hypothetical protein